MPPRCPDLHYANAAWGLTRPEQPHQNLATKLQGPCSHHPSACDVIPRDVVKGSWMQVTIWVWFRKRSVHLLLLPAIVFGWQVLHFRVPSNKVPPPIVTLCDLHISDMYSSWNVPFLPCFLFSQLGSCLVLSHYLPETRLVKWNLQGRQAANAPALCAHAFCRSLGFIVLELCGPNTKIRP